MTTVVPTNLRAILGNPFVTENNENLKQAYRHWLFKISLQEKDSIVAADEVLAEFTEKGVSISLSPRWRKPHRDDVLNRIDRIGQPFQLGSEPHCEVISSYINYKKNQLEGV